MTVIYGVTALMSFILLIMSYKRIREQEIWIFLVQIAVFVVNLGYFMLASSRTLEGALMSNRVAYLGSVFLPLCMLVTILRVCEIHYNRRFLLGLILISMTVFSVAASGGWLDVYYRTVSLTFVNGSAKLVKEYGPLHNLYYVYLFTYFGFMVGVIFYSAQKKNGTSDKVAIFLAAMVLGNVGIWFIEQLINTDFEFLSVSYLITEILLILLYSMLQDGTLVVHETAVVMENRSSEAAEQFSGQSRAEEMLTAREAEVLALILQDKRRKDIAEELQVSENTVKKHTSHIFAKLEVSNRKELFQKLK